MKIGNIYKPYLILLFIVLHQTASSLGVSDIGDIQQTFRGLASQWTLGLTAIANRMFWLLVLIQTAIIGIRLIFKQTDFQEFVAQIMWHIFIVGFMFFLLRYGWYIADVIIRSFVAAVAAAPTMTAVDLTYTQNNSSMIETTPSFPVPASFSAIPDVASAQSFFELGLQLSSDMINSSSSMFSWSGEKVAEAIGYFIMSLITMFFFAWMTTRILMVWVEAYIAIYTGVIMLGFLGSPHTREMGLVYFKNAVGVGLKLFIMLLVSLMVYHFLVGWLIESITVTGEITIKEGVLTNKQTVMSLLGILLVFSALIKGIPDYVQQMVTGTSFSTGERLAQNSTQLARGMAQLAGQIASLGAGIGKLSAEMTKTGLQGAAESKKGGGGSVRNALVGAAKAAAAPFTAAATVATKKSQNEFRGNLAGKMGAAMENKRNTSKVKATPPKGGLDDADGGNGNEIFGKGKK